MAQPRILIVDDEPTIVMALQEAFIDSGFVVDTARSGAAALARIEESVPDAVLLDKNMPGMSGIEVLRQIRESMPSLVVVLITGYGSAASAKETLNIGVDAYIEKPFPNIYEVVATIRNALHKRGRVPVSPEITRRVLVVGATRAGELLRSHLGPSVPVDIAKDLEEAVALVKEKKPALIAVDASAFPPQDTASIVSAVRAVSDAPLLVISERALDLAVLKTLTELGVSAVCDTASDLKERVTELARHLPPS